MNKKLSKEKTYAEKEVVCLNLVKNKLKQEKELLESKNKDLELKVEQNKSDGNRKIKQPGEDK